MTKLCPTVSADVDSLDIHSAGGNRWIGLTSAYTIVSAEHSQMDIHILWTIVTSAHSIIAQSSDSPTSMMLVLQAGGRGWVVTVEVWADRALSSVDWLAKRQWSCHEWQCRGKWWWAPKLQQAPCMSDLELLRIGHAGAARVGIFTLSRGRAVTGIHSVWFWAPLQYSPFYTLREVASKRTSASNHLRRCHLQCPAQATHPRRECAIPVSTFTLGLIPDILTGLVYDCSIGLSTSSRRAHSAGQRRQTPKYTPR